MLSIFLLLVVLDCLCLAFTPFIKSGRLETWIDMSEVVGRNRLLCDQLTKLTPPEETPSGLCAVHDDSNTCWNVSAPGVQENLCPFSFCDECDVKGTHLTTTPYGMEIIHSQCRFQIGSQEESVP